jgi:hypothetical protein
MRQDRALPRVIYSDTMQTPDAFRNQKTVKKKYLPVDWQEIDQDAQDPAPRALGVNAGFVSCRICSS